MKRIISITYLWGKPDKIPPTKSPGTKIHPTKSPPRNPTVKLGYFLYYLGYTDLGLGLFFGKITSPNDDKITKNALVQIYSTTVPRMTGLLTLLPCCNPCLLLGLTRSTVLSRLHVPGLVCYWLPLNFVQPKQIAIQELFSFLRRTKEKIKS